MRAVLFIHALGLLTILAGIAYRDRRAWPLWLYSILIVYRGVSTWRPPPRVDWPAKLRAATWPWEPAP